MRAVRLASLAMLSLVLIFLIHARAEASSSDWKLGPELGVNFAFASVSDAGAEGSSRIGALTGVSLERSMGAYLSFATGARYTQNGVQTKLLSLLPGTVKLDYFQLPAQIRVKLGNQRFRVFVAGGASLGLALSRTLELANLVEMDISQRFSGIDVCLDAGTGIELPISSQALFSFGVQMSFGIKDLSTERDVYNSRAISLIGKLLLSLF